MGKSGSVIGCVRSISSNTHAGIERHKTKATRAIADEEEEEEEVEDE